MTLGECASVDEMTKENTRPSDFLPKASFEVGIPDGWTAPTPYLRIVKQPSVGFFSQGRNKTSGRSEVPEMRSPFEVER